MYLSWYHMLLDVIIKRQIWMIKILNSLKFHFHQLGCTCLPSDPIKQSAMITGNWVYIDLLA